MKKELKRFLARVLCKEVLKENKRLMVENSELMVENSELKAALFDKGGIFFKEISWLGIGERLYGTVCPNGNTVIVKRLWMAPVWENRGRPKQEFSA